MLVVVFGRSRQPRLALSHFCRSTEICTQPVGWIAWREVERLHRTGTAFVVEAPANGRPRPAVLSYTREPRRPTMVQPVPARPIPPVHRRRRQGRRLMLFRPVLPERDL